MNKPTIGDIMALANRIARRLIGELDVAASEQTVTKLAAEEIKEFFNDAT
jgi:hypothetical protein